MQEINSYIKENDTDNVILNIYKQKMSQILAIEYTDMSSEDIEETVNNMITDITSGINIVLEQIIHSLPISIYTDGTYLYIDEECTEKISEYYCRQIYRYGCKLYIDNKCYTPISYDHSNINSSHWTYGKLNFIDDNGNVFCRYTQEYNS